MNISITPELEKFVKAEVKTGLYQPVSEVIRAALRRLKEDKENKPRFTVFSKAELEAKILEGIAELDRGEGLPGEQVFAEFKAHSAQRRRHGLTHRHPSSPSRLALPVEFLRRRCG